MYSSIDWNAVTALGTLAGVAILLGGGLIGYGVLSQRVKGLTAADEKQDARMDEMDTMVREALNVGNKVDLLRQSSEAGHQLLLTKQESAQTLQTSKFEGLAGEVRAFMQGQASTGGLRPARARSD